MLNRNFSVFVNDVGFGSIDSASVTPQFISPIWELVSYGNGETGGGKSDNGEENEGQGKGTGEGKRKEEGMNSAHSARALPSASYAQSFQGF